MQVLSRLTVRAFLTIATATHHSLFPDTGVPFADLVALAVMAILVTDPLSRPNPLRPLRPAFCLQPPYTGPAGHMFWVLLQRRVRALPGALLRRMQKEAEQLPE